MLTPWHVAVYGGGDMSDNLDKVTTELNTALQSAEECFKSHFKVAATVQIAPSVGLHFGKRSHTWGLYIVTLPETLTPILHGCREHRMLAALKLDILWDALEKELVAQERGIRGAITYVEDFCKRRGVRNA